MISVLSLDLFAKFVFFVKRSVFVLDDVHLEYSACGVFLSFNNLDLSTMVLDLADYIDQDLLETLELPTERHLVFSL